MMVLTLTVMCIWCVMWFCIVPEPTVAKVAVKEASRVATSRAAMRPSPPDPAIASRGQTVRMVS